MDAIRPGYSAVPSCPLEGGYEGMSATNDPPPSWEEVAGIRVEDEPGQTGPDPLLPPTAPSAPPGRGALAWRNRRYFIVVLTPLLLCPIPILISNSMGYMAYVILIMAVFWCTEAISLAVTALLPLVLFPLFGIMEAAQVSVQYFKDTNLLFFGGLMVAVAIEDCDLHRRIALSVLMLFGSKPRWMMFGFMIITAFLSMWISNTATTAMMLPIAQAVLDQVRMDNIKEKNHEEDDNGGFENRKRSARTKEEEAAIEMQDVNGTREGEVNPNQIHTVPSSSNLVEDNGQEERYMLMCKGIILCVPYAANIGGTGTLTGTGPNLILAGQMQSLYGVEVSYGQWMMYAVPAMLLCLLLTWIWLQILYVDRWCCKSMGDDLDHEGAGLVIRREYKNLGPMSFAQKGVLGHFIVLILLWVTRNPGFVPGWSVLFPDKYVTDATVAMFIAIMLFLFPSRMPKFMCGYSTEEDLQEEKKPCPALLEWPVVNRKMAWLVVLLLGGGFALAEGCKVSGLSNWIAEQFTVFAGFSPWVVALIVSIIIAAFTEVTSNTATATIFLPILGTLGTSIGVNPLFLMLPATVACSFAFMLPVATPPNAIAFAYEKVSVLDMVKTGFALNVICVLIANGSVNTFGMWVFDVSTFPDWANATSLAVNLL